MKMFLMLNKLFEFESTTIDILVSVVATYSWSRILRKLLINFPSQARVPVSLLNEAFEVPRHVDQSHEFSQRTSIHEVTEQLRRQLL